MPIVLYRQLSDRDAQGLVAYLRTVTPIRNVVPPSEYRMPLPPAYGPPVGQVPDVPRDDPVRYGAYLVAIAHCMECHSPLGPRGPDVQNRAGAGGQPIEGPWGVVVSPNITPDRETGIGGWTDEQIKAAITQAIRPDGARLAPPMPYDYFRDMIPGDLDAIIAYLRTVPAIRNEVR